MTRQFIHQQFFSISVISISAQIKQSVAVSLRVSSLCIWYMLYFHNTMGTFAAFNRMREATSITGQLAPLHTYLGEYIC